MGSLVYAIFTRKWILIDAKIMEILLVIPLISEMSDITLCTSILPKEIARIDQQSSQSWPDPQITQIQWIRKFVCLFVWLFFSPYPTACCVFRSNQWSVSMKICQQFYHLNFPELGPSRPKVWPSETTRYCGRSAANRSTNCAVSNNSQNFWQTKKLRSQ